MILLPATFRDDRPAFDRLLALTRQEARLVRVAHDWCEDAQGQRLLGPTPGVISVERWGEHRTLFYRLGILDGFEVIDGTLHLLVSSVGQGDSRTLKGYAYSDRALPNCDGQEDASRTTCYQALDDGWTIFLRRSHGHAERRQIGGREEPIDGFPPVRFGPGVSTG